MVYFSQGYTTHDWQFLKKLSCSQHDVFFLGLDADTRKQEERPVPAGVTVIDWSGGNVSPRDPLGWWRIIRELKHVFRTVNPDVVHAGPIQTCGFLTVLAGFSPLLLMSWGSDLLVDAERNWLWRTATKFTLRRSSALIVDSESGRDKARALADYPTWQILLLPYGVDLEKFRPAKRKPSMRGDLDWHDKPVIVSDRSWERTYGVEVVLNGFALALFRRPDLRLLLLGDGSLAPQIRAAVQAHNIAHAVHMPGHVAHLDICEYLRASDLYVSGSLSDGSSVSLLEAMGCGLPSVVTDLPSNREWVIEGRNGWLFRQGDPGELADKIVAAFADTELLGSAGVAAREIVTERADWNKNFQRLLDAYETLASHSGERAGISF